VLQLLCPKLSHVTVTDVSTVYGGLSAIVLWDYVAVFAWHFQAQQGENKTNDNQFSLFIIIIIIFMIIIVVIHHVRVLLRHKKKKV
jgi:F0F1-type ATP synthase assembly protein I